MIGFHSQALLSKGVLRYGNKRLPIKMASEKVSRKMLLEIKYVNANNAVIHTENSKLLLDLNCKLVTGILAKISLGTGI